jgi:hypothetical protein
MYAHNCYVIRHPYLAAKTVCVVFTKRSTTRCHGNEQYRIYVTSHVFIVILEFNKISNNFAFIFYNVLTCKLAHNVYSDYEVR